jgi:hypothetical protein
LKFPDKPFDCESFVVSGRFGYLIAKELKDDGAPIYRFPLLVHPKGAITLEKVGSLPVAAVPAGADLSSTHRRLAVITSAGAYVFTARGNVLTASKSTMFFVPFEHERMEGVTFTPEGLVVSAETGELFLFNATPFRAR